MWHAGDWTGVLSELVDGYDYNINVRAMLAGSPDAIKPTWTDLMMWSVLVGEPGLAHRLWGRSRMPLRAALMASQFCKLMADEPVMIADAAELDRVYGGATRSWRWRDFIGRASSVWGGFLKWGRSGGCC